MKQKLYTTVGLVIAIIVMLNLLAGEFHFRLDLTEGRQYSLSKATKDILRNLDEPVTIRAYFSANMPPHIQQTRRDFQDMLVEYNSHSRGDVMFEFINPNADEAREQEAVNKGIRPVMINVREKDQMKQQKAYLGAIVSQGKKQEVIPFIQPGAAMEYALSTAIKKLSIDDKPKIGFLQGHGEAGIYEMPQLNEQLQVLYQPEMVSITDSTDIPPYIHTLAVVRPSDSIPAEHLARLDAFLGRGGRLMLALNRVGGNRQIGSTELVRTGLEDWLAGKGLSIGTNAVIDAHCASVPIQQQTGFFMMQTNVSVPYLPIISNFAKEHPITTGLDALLLEFASTIRFSGDTSVTYTPLAFTSAVSDSLSVPGFLDLNRQWKEGDFKAKNLTVAAALAGPLGTATATSKLVVVTDGDFVVNMQPMAPGQQQPQGRQVQEDNVNFVSNAIDWLSDDTGLIGLRTKGVTSRPIAGLSDSTKTMVKYANLLLPVLLAVGYGIWRARKNRLKRQQRMNENYDNV